MRLGFFTMPIHPLDKDWRVCLKQDREAFILADELGFSEAYCGEHITDQSENITSCAIFIASLIDATKTIKLGTGTINMPNSHPAAIASQIAMLDHMLDGRFILLCGSKGTAWYKAACSVGASREALRGACTTSTSRSSLP